MDAKSCNKKPPLELANGCARDAVTVNCALVNWTRAEMQPFKRIASHEQSDRLTHKHVRRV